MLDTFFDDDDVVCANPHMHKKCKRKAEEKNAAKKNERVLAFRVF